MKNKKKNNVLPKKDNKCNKIILILIITIILLLITLITINKYSLNQNNIQEYKYHNGEFLKANYSANMLDYFQKDENIVISPLSITSSLGLLYNATDNNTKKEIAKFYQKDVSEINDFYENTLANYQSNNQELTELEKYYESLLEKFYTNNYQKISIEEISKLKSSDRQELILLLKKIEYSYLSIKKNDKNVTKKSIEKYKLTKEETNKKDYEIKNMINEILDNEESYNIKNTILNINNIYYNNTYSDFHKDFLNYNNIYKTNLKSLNFKDKKESASTINKDLSSLTDNKVNYIVDESNIQKKSLLITNTLYFNYKWAEFFDNNLTTLEDFYRSESDVSTIEMMHTTVDTYLENKNAKGFVKNFENDKYSFVGILPNDNNLKASNLDIESLLTSVKEESKVNISIPKFNFTYNTNLKKYFKDSKVQEIFTSKANFSQMTDEDIKLNNIYHKTYIEIGEKGTSSSNISYSALNSYVVDVSNKELNFNRPFYFLILDNQNNNVLLIGYVVNP